MSLTKEAGCEVLERDARCWSLPNYRCNNQVELRQQFGNKQTQSTIRLRHVTPIDHWTHRELADEVITRGIVSSLSVSQIGRDLLQASGTHLLRTPL